MLLRPPPAASRAVCALGLLVAATACNKHGGGRSAAGAPAPPIERPTGPMKADEAAKYALALVNHDRQEEGLEPVEWDAVGARAAERHVTDMVKNGFTAHWGTDGSVPEERYTEAGGEHMVQENAACFFDATRRELDDKATFTAEGVEKIEAAFMAETPPNDGHKKNILKPFHTHLGIAIAKPVGVEQPCMAQEFTDAYGEYDGIPRTARLGQNVKIAGEVHAPVQFGGVGIGRIEPAKPLTAAELNTTSVYRVPEPYVLFFPAGFKTPKPVKLKGNAFEIEAPLRDGSKVGRYEVSVWGKYPDDDALVMVSLRTVQVH
jgi:uncharacterized protein YkwD